MADKCEAYRAVIEESAGRGAAPGGALGAHLGECAACREFGREREALAGLLGGLASVAAPADFEFRLKARMARQRAADKSLLRRFRLAPGLAAGAVAACLLAASALYLRAPQTAHGPVAARPAASDSPSATDAGQSEPAEVADVNRQAEVKVENAAAVSEPERGAGQQTLSVPASGRRSAPRARRATREDTFGVLAATVIDGGHARQLAEAPRAVALRTSPETLRVLLRDERGGSQVLPMRSVSFGAQGPVGSDARAVRASYTDKEGVW